MKRAKHNGTGGFSLIEVVVAITLLGLVTAPVGTSLVLSHRLSARSEELMQDQLAVTNAVETLMAEGITEASNAYASDRFLGVDVVTTAEGSCYKVEVTSGSITVDTYIRPAQPEPDAGGAT